MIIFAIILLPLYASYISSLFYIQENLIWHGYNSHAHVVFKKGWRPTNNCFQKAIFTVKSQVFSGLPTKCHPYHNLAATVLLCYLYHSCEIYLLAFIMILIRYTICLYHIYVCYLSQIRLHSLWGLVLKHLLYQLIYSTLQNFTHNGLKK